MASTIDFLERRLEQTIGFVRFSETKNAALIGASVAILLAEVGQTKEFTGGSISYGALCASILLLIVAASISAISIMPQGRNPALSEKKTKTYRKVFNVVYFEEFKSESAETYVAKISEKLKGKLSLGEKSIAIDLADQCIQNAFIASKKFEMFRTGVFFFILGNIFLVVAMFLKT